MSKRKWLKLGGTFLGIAFAVNAVVSNFGDPMPMDDCMYPAIEKLAGYDKQDLEFLSGGYSTNLFGQSAKAEFQIKGEDKGKTIRIVVRKPLYLIWRVQKFENNS